MHHEANEATGATMRPHRTHTPSRERLDAALDLTAHYLPAVVNVLVQLLALTALFWGSFKVFMVASQAGILYALTFSGMHLPFCLFSVLFVLWFFDEYQGMGFLALVSAVTNALLI